LGVVEQVHGRKLCQVEVLSRDIIIPFPSFFRVTLIWKSKGLIQETGMDKAMDDVSQRLHARHDASGVYTI
jgi:hypothetical protein